MRTARLAFLAVAAFGSSRASAQVVSPAIARCAAMEGIEAPASLLDSIRFLVSRDDSKIASEPVGVREWRQTGAIVEVQASRVLQADLSGALQVWWKPGWWRTSLPEGLPLASLWLDDSTAHPLGPAGIVFVSSFGGSAVDFVELPISASVLSGLARAHSAYLRLVRRPSARPQPDSVTRVDIQHGDLRAMAALFAATACDQVERIPRRERSN